MKVIKTPEDYEKAKAALCQEQEEGYSGDDIAAVMLNYRRQHNIFEVGDSFVNYADDAIYTALSIDQNNRMHGKSGDKNVWTYFGRFGLRHATDQEIAAGHRIEIDQSGLEELSMYDIGPNVIVIDK